MIIVNKNGASLGKTFADLGVSEEAKVSNGAIFEKALQTVAQPQSVQHSDVNVPATPQNDWQNTLAQEKLIQDQLSAANTSALMVTGPGDVSLGNNDSTFAEPQISKPLSASKQASDLDPVLKNIIEWRQEQIDPMMQCKVGDLWAKGGLKDPFSDPLLISQAKEILEKTKYRLELNPSMKVPWDGDWRTALAKDREVEAQRNAVLAEGSKNSNFVTGG